MSVKTIRCSLEELGCQAYKDILTAIAGGALLEYILNAVRIPFNRPPEQPPDDTPEPVVLEALPITANATISQPTLVVTESKEGKAVRKL